MSFLWSIALILLASVVWGIRQHLKENASPLAFQAYCWIMTPIAAIGGSYLVGASMDLGLFTPLVMFPTFCGAAAYMAPKGRGIVAIIAFLWLQFPIWEVGKTAYDAAKTRRWITMILTEAACAFITYAAIQDWTEERKARKIAESDAMERELRLK